MSMLAAAASLLLLAAVAVGHVAPFRPPILNCNDVDYVFVLNLQQKDCTGNPAEFQQQMTDFIGKLRSMTQSGVGVGVVTFSKHVEHKVPVTQNLDLVAGLVQRLLTPPRFDGIATGDALLAAKKLLLLHKRRLAELGIKNRKQVVVAVVAGDRNQGVQRTFAASVQLRKVAPDVFAVNLAGGATRKELFRIASDGTRGIFEATTIVDAASKTDKYAQVFCPCPLSWTTYDNCTIRGQVQVQRFFYERTPDLPYNCVLNSSISFEPCDCPANRVERSVCVIGVIRVSTFVYTRPDNNSDCVESVTTTTEPCGRATGCESFVCPPGSQCITENGTIRCVCINPNDIFKVTGCESCGDRAPLTSYGPCINGQRAVMVTTFSKINATSCLTVNNRSTESCPDCPVNATRQYGPCVRGYQQVIVVFYELKDGRCYRSMRSHQAECRLTSEYQCIGTVLSGGLFVTFDGQLIDFPGPCSYLLTERVGQFRVLVQQAIKFPSVPYLTRIQSVMVIKGNVSYELTHDLVLKVSGVVQSLPYSDVDNSVEAFYSDDALVLSTGELYVQMRGAAAAVSVRSSDSLRGILGNCNGNRTDDYTDSTGTDVSQRPDRNSALGISFQITVCVTTPCCPVAVPPTCDTNTSLTARALNNCGQLAADPTSPFAHCGAAAMKPLYEACVAVFCRAQDNPSWQSSLVCSTFEAAAFRCFLQQSSYNRSSYPVFRTPSFCPKTCGHNAEFVDNIDYCPSTCARHFFSQQSLGCATPFGYKSRNANGQTPIPGCQCKPGFVLDGSNCVPPNQCECISDLCIDRENRTVCESWKAQGYCNKYPLQMRRFCKLTCEQCRVPCQDQINRATCQKVKAEGKCSDSFYSQMCQLTCNPTDCECPPCKTVRGPCDPLLKNRVVNRYCFAPDDTGHCQRNLTSTTYEACGTCQTETRSVDVRACDYCAQQQVTRSTVSVRESTGEMRCILISTNSTTRSAGCECLADSNRTVCYRNTELFLIRTVAAPSADCSSCLVTVTENPVRNVTCARTIQYGECDKVVTKRRKVTVTRGLVRNCQCDYVTEEFEEMCVCPKPHWTPLVCFKNHAMLRWFISFSLVHGQCVAVVKPHKQPVPCHQRRKIRHHCKGCVRVRQEIWFDRHHCRCVRRTRESKVGSCCCPESTTTRGHCIGGQRHVTVIRHVLDNHECQTVTRVISERCGCPPSRPIKECDSETGVVTIGRLVYRLIHGTCEEIREVKSVQTKCKPMRVTHRGECRLLKPDATVKHRRIHYELWERVEGTCRCRRILRAKMVACGCREPQVRLSKCPSDCPATAVSCPDHCRRTRAVVEFRSEEGRCEPEERNQEDLPCCCDKPPDKAPVCENGRVLATRKFDVRLVANACLLKEFLVRTDVARHCDQTDVRRERHGDLIIVMHRAVHDCRCVWRKKRTSCPVHCPPPTRVVRCDGASREHVVVERSHRLHACRCVPVKKVRRQPVECPEPKVEREVMCSGENPAIVFTHISFELDNECHCKKSTKERRLPCEREECEQRPTVRLICEGDQLYNVVTRFTKDEDGNCAPKETRHEVETPRCTGHKKKPFKKCVEGKMIEFVHWIQSHKCRCQTKIRKRVLGPCTRDCKHKNHGRPRTRLQCDKETNQLVTLRLVWHFREDRCVRAWVAVHKRAEPDCPPPRTRRHPCDQHTGKQRIEHHEYEMHECRCRGPRVKVTFKKCSCKGPKVLGRYCDARKGRIVVRMLTHHWNFELGSCQKKLLRKFIPIPCPHHNGEKHGPCQHGHMVFEHIRYVRNRQTCSCSRKVEARKVNCHCPVVVRHGKCTHDHHMAVTTILYRKFDVKKRRCVIASQKRRHRRCRCPKRRSKKSCVDGKWEVNGVTHRLVSGECEADRSEEKFAVACRKPPVIRTTECNKDTCYREILTYHWEVNPHNCRCRLRLVRKQFCRCCGCPLHHVQKSCIHSDRWRLTLTVHSLRLKTCSKTCRKHVTHRTERVRCPPRRRVHWTRCQNCRSRMLVTKYISVNCHCRHHVEKTDKFRACCCKPKTKVRKWCQQSTGFWVSEVKRLVLRNHKCVWHTEIKYLPKPVCQLPETPVVYGDCDTSTCLQNVTNIVNILNKHTCSCQLENVTAGTRPCCCINPNPTSSIICIGDNTLQRTTVTPVFNESSHTCVSITSIVTQIIECGSGDTRSSDPPCIGDTRTIITTRSAAVNCQCLNQTISTRSEMCQCPPPSNWTRTCDATTGQIVKTQTIYTLTSGQCIPTTNIKIRTITCDTTPVSVPVCNNDTCVETVTTTVQRLDKPTCSCVASSTIAVQQCCCPATVQTRSECVTNEMLIVNTRQTLDVATRTCQLVNSTTRAGEVPCANETRVDMGCNLATRNRTIVVTSRALVNCVCQTIGTTVLRQLCACPPDRSFIGPCNLRTCQRRITTVHFNMVSLLNGTITCIRTNTYKFRPCCCTVLGQKRVQVTTQCDQETGNLLVSKHWKKFIISTEQCREFHKSWAKQIDCSGKFDGEDKLVHSGPCDRLTGLRTVTVKWYTHDTHTCRCKLHVKEHHKVCSCKHLHGIRHSFCKAETNEIMHQRKFFVLQDGVCAPQEENKREQVTCPEDRQVREACNECSNKKVVSYNVLANCKCERKEEIVRTKCCCPETQFHKKCHKNRIRLTTVRFHLSVDKKSCEKVEDHRHKRIKCRKRRVRKGRCNRHTCMAQTRDIQFHIKRCKCHRRVRVHKRRCCCPKAKSHTRCHRHDTLVHEHTIYKLGDGRCVPRVSRKQNRIRCSEPRKIGKSHCNPETGERHVKFQAFTVHECRCVPKPMRRVELCACPRPRTVRQPCEGHRRERVVFQIVYKRHEDKCRPMKKLLYKEPCRCPESKHKKMCDEFGGQTLLSKTLSFRLVSRHGRRTCIHSEHEKPEKIKCGRRSVRRTPCRHGHCKIMTTEHRVHRCRCVRKQRVRRVKCAEKHRRGFRKQICQKDCLILITVIIDPETGEKREQRQVKRVICKDRPRTVPLSKGCTRRGEDKGLYRKVAIIRSFLHECRCKQKRKISWRLCRCEGTKKSHRCVHDIIEQDYKEEHKRHHGHCKTQRSRRTREHRCPKRPLSLKKGRCDRRSCKCKVLIRKCWMEHCRCRCRNMVGDEVCCTRKPINKRFCEGHHMNFMSTHFRMKTRGIKAKDSETGDEWKQIETKPFTRRWSKPVRCPKPEVRQSCNRATGVLTKRITTFKDVHCKCRPRMRTMHSRCRCPTPHTRTGPCVNGRRQLKHTVYHLGKDERCHKRHSSSWKPCACPKSKRSAKCSDGCINVCTIEFKHSNGCRPKRHCHRKDVRCPPPIKKRDRCSRRTNKAKLILIRFTVNKKTCQCDRHIIVRYVYCSCKHLVRKHPSCQGNGWVTVSVNFRLQGGECLPDETVTHKAVECRPPHTELVPRTCERRSGLSSSGTQIARTVISIPEKCHCKNIVRTFRVPCICSLIPKYRTEESVECSSDDKLVVQVTSFHLVHGKCLPRVQKTTKVVECHGERTRRTACLKDDMGDSFQYILTLRNKPHHCHCRWVIVRRVRRNCGCRPPTSQTSCVGDNIWEKVVVRYLHPAMESASCEPHTSITTGMVNCTEPRTIIEPCNTGTCYAKEITVTFQPKHCFCHPFHSYRMLRCCCPPDVVSPEQCNPVTNQFEQVTSHYDLVNDTCVLTQNTTYRSVSCDTRSGETNVSVCNTTTNRQTVSVRDVAIINCQCASTTRSTTQPCACPNTIRVDQGLCNGTQSFTVDNYYRFVFNSTTGTCVEVLYNSVQRPCLCTGVSASIVCVGVNGNILRRITYVERLVNNTCVNMTIITDQEITCAGNGTSGQTRSDCDPTTNTRSINKVNFVVANCTCAAQTTRSGEPCNCFERNGGRIETSICRADNVTVRTVTYYYDGPGGVCLPKVITTEQRVTCSGIKEVREECNPDTGKVEIHVFQLVPVACQCVWSEKPARYEDCVCKHSKTKRLCEKGKHLDITTYYELTNGRCEKRESRKLTPVRCGKKAGGVHYGDCDSGSRSVVKLEHRLHNCRCVTKQIRRHCPCHCPNSRTWQACKDNQIVTFRLFYNLVDCKCVKKLLTRESEVFCAKRRSERTDCIRGENGDGHLTVVTSHHRSVNCRCEVEKREELEACECQPLENQQRKCHGRKLTVVTTQRQLVGGACRRVVVRTETRSVACPLQSVRAVSPCNRHGYRLLERTRWKVRDCRCEPRVRLERQRCSKKCDLAPKAVRSSDCNKATCTQRLYHYYKDEKCRSKHFAVTARCCCPHSHHGKRKCLGPAFELSNLFYKLELGVCIMSDVTYRQEIDCQRRDGFETATLANGDTVVLKTWHAVKNCHCEKFKTRAQVKHIECKPPEVKTECITVPEPRFVHTVARYIKQTKHGACEKLEEVTEKPIICPLDIIYRGSCTKDNERTAYVRKVKRITFEKLDCRCISRESIHHEVCRCFQSRVATRCHKTKGVLIVSRWRFEVSPDGSACHESCDTRRVQINCDETWRAPPVTEIEEEHQHGGGEKEGEREHGRRSEFEAAHSRKRRDLSEAAESENEQNDEHWDGEFHKVLEREVRVGCACRVQRRECNCQSRCPPSTKRLVCEDDRNLFRVETVYHRTGPCRCSYRVRRHPLHIRLPEKKVVYHRCHDCKQRVETIEHEVQECKVKRITRWHTRRCCCRKKPKISVHCKASQMILKQVRTEHLTEEGHCVPRYRNTYTIVNCRPIIHEKALTKCIHGRRVWRRELERLENCLCKRVSKRITRPCGFKACKSAVVRFGTCINCASKETKTEFIYNPASNHCEAKKFHKIHNCCCPRPKTFKRCVGNRLRLVTKTSKFNCKTGKCKKSEKFKDITRKAYKRCLESKRTTISHCMENGYQVVVTLQPTLVDCVCHKSQSFRFVRCRCDQPQVTEACVQNGTVKYRRTIRQELEHNTCKNITDETYSQIECPVSSTSEGICDSTTCQRVITDVSYTVSDCTCMRQTSMRLETCCCPPIVNETRSCQRADNTLVVTQQFQEFDLQNRACVTRTRSDRSGTVCPQNYRSFAGPCDQFRNNSLYRTVSESIIIVSGCECVGQTTTRTELCGCDTAKEYTMCTPENQLLTYRIEYNPDANNTICLPNRVDLSLRDVVCDGTRRSDVPICSTGTRSAATGETRITVVTTWMTRSGNCSCAAQTRSEQLLCACPDNSTPRTFCDKWRHEKVNVTLVYNLMVTGSIRQCIPSKVVTRLGPVRCQAPVVQLGRCQFGLMAVRTLVHKLHGCGCMPKVYKHQQRCHKILQPCINKLPDWLCADLDRRFGICHRNFTNATNPELQQLGELSALCDRECNRCDGCHALGGKWQFKYTGRECLVTDVRYPGLFIRKDTTFHNCLKHCKADLACRSFDFYIPSGQCTLARVDRDRLHDLLLPRHHMVGAIPADNRHRGATRCNMYERICSLRVTTRLEEVQLGCPGRHVVASDSHCKCQPVSLALGLYPYCYRTLTVAYYVRSPSGKCEKKATFVHVACRPCRDHLPLDKCQALDSQGGCAISSSAKLCAKTCRLCECDGREFVRIGRCDKHSGKRVDTVIRTEWVPGFRLCQVIVQKVTKRCHPCIVGLQIIPLPCIGGFRYVLYITTTLVHGQCISRVKRIRRPCRYCPVGVTRHLGPCVHGHRTVNSFFAVSHGAECKEEKTSYEVGCADCPPPLVRTQPCIGGRRIRQVKFYVRPPGSSQCFEDRFETEDRCGTLCHDQITGPECTYQQHTGQCEWNLLTRRSCPSTCNRC